MLGEGNLKFWCPMLRKTFESQSNFRQRYQSSLLRRNKVFRLAVTVFITLIVLSSRVTAEGRETYSINLPAQSVAESLTDLSVQIEKQLLFPYQLAASIDANPVNGRYTLQQVLDIMLRGTGFSGGLTTKGVLMISIKKSEANQKKTEGIDDMNTKKNILASTIAFFVGSGVQGVVAQEDVGGQEESGWLLEEIVVTAQKREERLIDVPISITSLSAEDLKQFRIQDVSDLSRFVPNLSVSDSAPVQVISIRGIGTNNNGTSALTGLYLNEVPLSALPNAPTKLQAVDLKRVEVLKGPQGTLYGQGSVGGTIRFIANSPSTEKFEAELGISAYETSGSGWSEDVTAVANLPVIKDALAFRVAAKYNNQSGWIDQPSRARDNANDSESSYIRISGLWQGIEKLDVELMAVQYRNKGGAGSITNSGNTFDVPNVVGTPIPSTGIEEDYDIYNVTLSYDLGFATLLSSSSHFQIDNFMSSSPTFLELIYFPPPSTYLTTGNGVAESIDGITQEIRLAGNNDKLDWTFGVFYNDNERDNSINDLAVYLNGVPAFSLTDVRKLYSSESIAFFADLSYSISEKWNVSFGTRHFSDEKTFKTPGNEQLNEEFDNLSSRLSLSYAFTEDSNLYVSISEGFRSGGHNDINTSPVAPPTYNPESVLSYEIGNKSSLLDGRLYIDSAIYLSKYTDYQSLNFDPANSTSFVFNTSEAEIRGIEWSAKLAATKELALGLSGNITESEYTKVGELTSAFIVGDNVDNIPKYSYSVFADITFNWSSNIRGFAHIDYSRQGPRAATSRGSAFIEEVVEIGSIGILNSQLGANWKNMTLKLFGKNINNEKRASAVNTTTTRSRLRPRHYGIEFVYNF